MKRRFLNTSKKALAIALAAVMAMPTIMANPIEAEAAIPDASELNPAYYYEFDQDMTNSGTAGTADATIVGGGTYVNDTERGWVFDNCSGTASELRKDYVQLPASFVADLSDESAMTIGMWIKSPESNQDVADYTEFGNGYAPVFTMTNSSVNWNWFCVGLRGTSHGNFSGSFDNHTNGTKNYYNEYLEDSEWHYLTATVTASRTVVYIDGEIQNEMDRTDATVVFSDVYDIVAIGGNQVHCWGDGDAHVYFDDVAIWFEELSASDILYLATGERAAAITGISAVDTTVNTGETVQVVATYAPADTADFGFTLSSSDESVVTVDGAYLLGVSAGTATVTITSTVNTSISDTFTVTVNGSEWGSKTAAVTEFDNAGSWAGTATPYERLEGDFNITYTFKNSSEGALAERWENFFLQIMDANGNVQHYRCDAWCDSQELGTQNWDGTDINWGENYATYIANMVDADVTVNVVRQGTSLVVNYTMEYADESVDTAVCKITIANPTDVLFVRLSSGFSKVSNIELSSLVQTIGAQTKEDDNSVLGFVTTIDKDAFEAIGGTDKGTKNDLKMGVLVKNSDHPTDAAMILENVGDEIKQIETDYVATLATLDTSSNDTDTYAFRSVITGIEETTKEYTAVAYVTYTVDGTEYTVYGPEITRSVDDVK